MKAFAALRLATLPLLLLPLLATAQQKQQFNVTDPLKHSTYGERPVFGMKGKELKAIFMATGDEQIVRNMRKISTKRAVSLTGIIIGDLVMAGGLAITLSGNDGGTGLLAGGAGILLIGAIAGSGQKGLIKRSMLRYNEVTGGSTSFLPGTTTINGQTALGGTLSFTF
ncbi:MAG: hypothetical protein IPL81_06715 [Flavobacteriales bacterium]|nr:hypothetical protein [Flavobacteriales bacterium]MBK6894316.1 hypothetical protein [Flavobacteriales bacterium]MBK7248245.1 hypothetical protein [Flavobacteriales bacterium]MBK7287403.1 hypothetical protein [Flavobacteriales bacterium]MBK9059564.1 hypothetical protein [Flavobacteriales bacterium]